MLPAAYRFPLRSHPDFFMTSLRLQTDHLIAYVRQNECGHLRCSIVVPKKTAALSVERSHLKRILAVSMSSVFPPTIAVDLVLRVKKRLPFPTDYELITTDLQSLAHQINSRLPSPATSAR